MLNGGSYAPLAGGLGAIHRLVCFAQQRIHVCRSARKVGYRQADWWVWLDSQRNPVRPRQLKLRPAYVDMRRRVEIMGSDFSSGFAPLLRRLCQLPAWVRGPLPEPPRDHKKKGLASMDASPS